MGLLFFSQLACTLLHAVGKTTFLPPWASDTLTK